MSAAIAMHRPEWIDAVTRQHVLEVAHALGLEVQKSAGASGGSFACPACSAARRHQSRHDRRLACGVRSEGTGWRCFECEVSGDQLHLVAVALVGRRYNELDAHGKARVRAWVEEWTGTAPESGAVPRPRLELVIGEPAPQYPPPDEVLALWKRGISVGRDQRVAQWLARDRGLDVDAIASAELAIALPWGAECPDWAAKPPRGDRPATPWSKTAYRCLFPMLDHAGKLRNVLARYVGTPQSDRAPKSRAPNGYQRRGLVLADRVGQRMLDGSLAEVERVVVAEGEMDMLAFGSRAASQRTAVLAVVSGSWTAEVAARVPDGARVIVATHNDADGEKYARGIYSTLAPRLATGAITARRWRWSETAA